MGKAIEQPLLFSFDDEPQDTGLYNGQRNPFDGRRVAPIGLFGISHIKEKLITMGAETYPAGTQKAGKLNDDISGNTHYIICGKCPNDKKLEKLREIIYKGWDVRVLTEEDFMHICNGFYDGYWTDKEVKKNLTFTIEHFENNRIVIPGLQDSESTNAQIAPNPVLEKDIYVPENINGSRDVLAQMIGNIGAYANYEIEAASESDKSIPIIMLADETIEKLRNGERDETIRYVEQSYNKSAARYLIYRFILESDLLNWMKSREEFIVHSSSYVVHSL